MAAYAALASLLNDLEVIPNHAIHSFSFDNKQLSSLSQTVEFLIAFIETYDSHGEAAQVLESRITSLANAAHDVIESHIVDQISTGSTRCGKVRSYFLLDLQRAIHSMEFVKRKAVQFKAKSRSKAEQTIYSSPSPPPAAAATSSEPLKNSSGMVGFDEAVLRLVDILAGPSNQRLVVPVAGMGGLGKTSLTKAVYEHSYVREQFDVRLWATISQQYDAENILTQLLYGENKSTTGGDAGELGEALHKRLYGSRYLVVLDDMWSLEAWDKIRRYLPENGNGSRVAVTTRLSDLAAHLNSSPFKLNFLDEDKSWELFCRKAFGEEDCPVELEEIGKKIVKRCRGLPLSIVVMGGHLSRSSRGVEYWEKVAGYMNPISSVGEEEQCLEILSLSYQHLPACLKPCFLYLGIYMEDEWIDTSDLLRHWINEGFIRAKRGLSMEEVGEHYLKDLIDRNLILVVLRRWNGEVEWCRIHDSVREVCLKVCKKEKFLCEVDETTTQVRGYKVRRIVSPKGKNFNSHTIGVKQLSPPPLRLSTECSLLRVLLRDIKISGDGMCLPSAHFQPVNSRTPEFDQYMRLQSVYSILTSLPACWNLQTLHMYYCSSDGGPMSLPYEIWEMPQLRILKATSVFLTDPATGEGSNEQEEGNVLRNLHTLEGVVNLRLTEEVCKRMPNLKRLWVRYDHFCGDSYLHNLGRFNKLKSLNMSFDNDSKWCDVVPTLTLPTSLEELYLQNSHLGWEDLTRMISSPLPHLGFLYVHSVRGSEWNLEEEEVFCCLKRLWIYGCADLIHWKANSSHFPVLERLELYSIPKLSEIPLDIGDIPTLRLVQLRDCGASAAVSAVRMVMEQEIDYGNHDIQLHVHFWEGNREEFERFEEMMEEECLITTNNIGLFFNYKMIEKTLL